MAVTTPAVPATGVLQANNTGQDVDVTVTAGTVQTIYSTSPEQPTSVVTTPAVPASTVTATNTNPFPVLVALTGGTTTVIAVNGTTVATTTPANVVVPAGGTIAVTYSVAPTWVWTGIAFGLSGNPLSNPFSLQLAPGGAVAMFYTAGPTWAWTDPLDTAGGPEVPAENLGPTYNQETDEPEPAHGEGGETGLGIGVAN